MTNKRITLNQLEAAHLFELAYDQFQYNCPACDALKAKLTKLIEEKEANKIIKILKKHPYH